eukprot:SAG11_NODE_296_length_11092_cov_24.402620_4_plen_116_part_00
MLHYLGSPLHRLLPGYFLQGGDLSHQNGGGGESIYGMSFEDEWPWRRVRLIARAPHWSPLFFAPRPLLVRYACAGSPSDPRSRYQHMFDDARPTATVALACPVARRSGSGAAALC